MRSDGLTEAAADLILGVRCAGCSAPGRGVCARCLAIIRCQRPHSVPVGAGQWPAVVASADYSGITKSLLIAAKERSALGLTALLAERLSVSILALKLAGGGAGQVVLLPVPSTPAAVAQRGLDFTTTLARLAARRLRRTGCGVVVSRGLRHTRRPADQAGLGMLARQQNLAGAFRVSALIPAGDLIVVDDIVTTGATLTEAFRALQTSGRSPLGAATVAATKRRW